ncbi:ROK family protein [Phenylobacterium montanum]|uniref:fructokinase n=1 Tax=Phenylobacterium montanum TaxID=2823693 RepID=A0A975IVU4_9CAUL|nr:ROK family protein [Caulobacter sp. S6]QUD88919.1 ROK family protein [Caulobacter sp. S6]
MSRSGELLAGVELGGTKCVCIVGTGPDDVATQISVATGDDAEATLGQIEAILRDLDRAMGPIAALGVASFGPVDLDPRSPTWGHITSTPKPGWSQVDVGRRLARALDRPTGFDTDVNGAALAEGRWGAAQGLADFAYVTVGTGVGAGLIAGGRPIGGFSHPEIGHMRVARREGDDWPGSCPFHGDCVEGLASGSAIKARLGGSPARLDEEDPVWDLVAHVLAGMAHNLAVTAAPRRILMGGGVMNAQPHLFPRIRRELTRSLAGYLALPEMEDFIRPPGLGDMAGPLGALAVAADALAAARSPR